MVTKRKEALRKIECMLKEYFSNNLYRSYIKVIDEDLHLKKHLDFDTLDEVEFIMALEDEFNIGDIPDNKAIRIKTIADAIDVVLPYI